MFSMKLENTYKKVEAFLKLASDAELLTLAKNCYTWYVASIRTITNLSKLYPSEETPKQLLESLSSNLRLAKELNTNYVEGLSTIVKPLNKLIQVLLYPASRNNVGTGYQKIFDIKVQGNYYSASQCLQQTYRFLNLLQNKLQS
jgi:hypothetical protein